MDSPVTLEARVRLRERGELSGPLYLGSLMYNTLNCNLSLQAFSLIMIKSRITFLFSFCSS